MTGEKHLCINNQVNKINENDDLLSVGYAFDQLYLCQQLLNNLIP